MTILLAEQNLQFALALADRLYILEKGHIRYEGTAENFRADPSLQRRFLAV
jgi:branched-chain amino acid transport system ATP-binding protein